MHNIPRINNTFLLLTSLLLTSLWSLVIIDYKPNSSLGISKLLNY